MILTLPDDGATEALGRALAQALPKTGNAKVAAGGAVVYLEGELGAGKTTCVRAMLRSLGVSGTVRSPSYPLIETYPAGALTCVHVDLYRLRDSGEFEELGLRDVLAPGHLVLIEWPDRMGAARLPPDLRVQLAYKGAGRVALLEASSERGAEWLRNLANDTRLIPYLPNLT